MKRILCYGDSNTWGHNPKDASRFRESERWTKLLQQKLVEEGYAEVKYLYDDYKYTNQLQKSEKEAKAKKSKIWSEMLQAKEVQREKPFYINIPAKEIYDEELEENVLVQGIIDLYYINNAGELVLVDFKTDYVENRDAGILIDKYKVQLDLYKRALIQALGRNVDKVYIYSTYLDKEIEVRDR